MLNQIYFQSSANMNQISDNSVDLIITSPPYWNCKDYGEKKEDVANCATYQGYLDSLLVVWKECERILKPNGKLVINVPLLPMLKKQVNDHYNRTIYDLPSDIQFSILTNTKLHLYDLYFWKKSNPQKKLMFGSYPYPRNFYCQNIIEFLTVYVKSGKPDKLSQERKEKSKLTEKEWVEYTQQIWEIPVPNKKDMAYGKFPAIMPEEIVKRLVRLFTLERDVVLDPFAGSGTTLKVAQELGRNYVGYELYEKYFSLIKQKLNNKIEQRTPI